VGTGIQYTGKDAKAALGKGKTRIWGAFVLLIILILPAVLIRGQADQWKGINLGPNVNSPDNDFGPIISADGNYLLFTSDRPGFGGQDFWMCQRIAGEWRPAVNMGASLNTLQNEGPDTFSVDKRTLYFTGCDRPDGKGKCDIYYTRITDLGTWSPPTNLGPPINTQYDEANASLSSDGRHLFFSSVRPGNMGGSLEYKLKVEKVNERRQTVTEEVTEKNWDIWESEWTGTGWGAPRNLGPNINTPMSEQVAFIHSGGETLYFSSNGRGGYGGLDIFMSKLVNGVWQPAQNLGPTINTRFQETYISVPGSGDLAYLSAWREGGFGKLDLYVAPIPPQFQPRKIIIIMGKVYDVETGAVLKAVVRLEYFRNAEEVAITSSDKKTGRYEVALPVGNDYVVSATCPGYMFYSKKFEVPLTMGFQIVRQDIPLTPIKANESIVLENIYFDFDKATLRPESKGEINRLVQFMRDNPNVVVEISGHTDSVGGLKYNMKLSGARAQSVVAAILQAGIPPIRMRAMGYAFTKPRQLDERIKQKQAKGDRRPLRVITQEIIKETNATPDGKQLNRRVEFKILKVQ